MFLGREPAVVLTLILAVIELVVLFGVNVTPEQQGAIMFVATAAIGFAIRSSVAPVDNRGLPR